MHSVFNSERQRKIDIISTIFPRFPLPMVSCLLQREDGNENQVIKFLLLRGWEAKQEQLSQYIESLSLVKDIHYTTRYYHGKYSKELWDVLKDYGDGSFLTCYVCEEDSHTAINSQPALFYHNNNSDIEASLSAAQKRVSFAGAVPTLSFNNRLEPGYYLMTNQENKCRMFPLTSSYPAIRKTQLTNLVNNERILLITPVMRSLRSATGFFFSDIIQEEEFEDDFSSETSQLPRVRSGSFIHSVTHSAKIKKYESNNEGEDEENGAKPMGFLCFVQPSQSTSLPSLLPYISTPPSNTSSTYSDDSSSESLVTPRSNVLSSSAVNNKLFIPASYSGNNIEPKKKAEFFNPPEDFDLLQTLQFSRGSSSSSTQISTENKTSKLQSSSGSDKKKHILSYLATPSAFLRSKIGLD